MGILPLKGRVDFAGEDMARLEIEDRVAAGLSLVPEHRELFATMSVEDNLQLGAFRIARAVAAQSLRAGLHAVSAAEGAAPATRRHAVGRRAADAGDGPRPDGRAKAADAGRAEPGSGPDHRRRHLPHHRRVARQRRVGAAGRAERAGRAANRRPRLCDGARRIHPERHRPRTSPPTRASPRAISASRTKARARFSRRFLHRGRASETANGSAMPLGTREVRVNRTS